MSEEVDLIVVKDHKLAELIVKASGAVEQRAGERLTAAASDRRFSSKEEGAMHLLGDASGPHMAHFHARHENGCIELDWEVRNAGEIRWRVLRSEQGYADSAEPPGANGQVLVNESTDTYLADQGLDPDKHYCYTVFSQEPDATWRKQVEVKLRPHDLLGWVHPQAHDIIDAEASLAKVPSGSEFTQRSRLDGLTRHTAGMRIDIRGQSSAVRDWLTLDGGD